MLDLRAISVGKTQGLGGLVLTTKSRCKHLNNDTVQDHLNSLDKCLQGTWRTII